MSPGRASEAQAREEIDRLQRSDLEDLSRRHMAEFGRGIAIANLRKMRQFYRMFEIRDALGLESTKPKRAALRLASAANTTRHAVCDELSWRHDRLLIQVENPARDAEVIAGRSGRHKGPRDARQRVNVN